MAIGRKGEASERAIEADSAGAIKQSKKLLNTTKPGWLARLLFCGTGSFGLVSIGDPECQNL